ncbi:MAG: hypothetical protein LUQ40_00650 [Methanomicrobiales archaeon]|nr:hypothetical protein [Methanomicrobiales archaeon]
MLNKTKITIFIIVLVALIAVVAGAFFVYDSIPPSIVSATARVSGGDGALVVVEYKTDKPMKTDFTANDLHLIVDESGNKLWVRMIPKIGMLISKSTGKDVGWFIIDNGDLLVKNGTNVTIVIGSYRLPNYTVTG